MKSPGSWLEKPVQVNRQRPIRKMLVASILAACLSQNALAQLPLARLSTIFPAGGQIGTTFEVSLTGVDLDDAKEIHFSTEGIAAKPKLNGSGQPDANKFIVTIASNVQPAVCDARVIGRFGISNPRVFVLDDLPEVIGKSPNHTLSNATEIAVETLVNGRCEPNAVDYFKFGALKGRRVLIQCLAKEIDSRMDDAIVLCDATGKELERKRRGGLIDFTAPADGQYLIKVHDFLFRGGEEYFYRLKISAGPFVDYIFPPAAVPGSRSEFALYGRNLPGGIPVNGLTVDRKPLEQITAQIELTADTNAPQRLASSLPSAPAAAVLDGLDYRLNNSAGSPGAPGQFSNPVLLSFATAPVVAEQEPNDKPAQAQQVSLPCELVGQFYPQGDQDWFTFEVKKGDVYWIEVFSQRLGLPTDPFLLVQRVTRNEKGEEKVADVQELYDSESNIGGPEFNTATRDPVSRFEAKEDGTHRLQVRDLFNETYSNPRHVYRLSLRKETPDFCLVALPQAPPPANKDAKVASNWTTFLRRGETVPVKVLALRRDGFNGPIQLGVQGLPSGVTAPQTTIEPGANSALLFLIASEDAPGWAGAVKVLGTAKIGEREVIREARGGAVVWNVPDYNTEAIPSRLTRDFAFAVSRYESVPISIAPAEEKIAETAVGGKLQLPIKLVRRGEFDGVIKLKAAGIPALDSMAELEIAAKTNAATLEIDLAKVKIPAGTHRIHLQATTQGKYWKLNPEELKLAEADAQAADAAAKQAEKTAGELAAAAQKTADDLAAATKTAEEAQAAAKTAANKLAAVRAATGQLEDLVAAAEKEAVETGARAKTAAEVKAAAEQPASESAGKSKDAEAKKTAASNRAKELHEKLKPKDVTVFAYSQPIEVRVAAAEKKK
jgi:hypothetical protein